MKFLNKLIIVLLISSIILENNNVLGHNETSSQSTTKEQQTTFFALGITLIVISASIGILIIVKRQDPVLVNSSVSFRIVMIFGIILGTCIIFPYTSEAENSCIWNLWLFILSFDLVMGNLFWVSWRVTRLVKGAKKMRKIVISNRLLVKAMSCLIAFDCFVLMLYTIFDPPILVTVAANSYQRCEYGLKWYFLGFIIAYKMIFLAYGAYLGYQIADLAKVVRSGMNKSICVFADAKEISLCIYNYVLIGVMVGTYLQVTKNVPVIHRTVGASGLVFLHFFLLLTAFGQRVFQLLWKKKVDDQDDFPLSVDHSNVPVSNTGAGSTA